MCLYRYKGLHSTKQFNDLLPVGIRMIFFFRLSFRNCKRCVYNCDNHLSFNFHIFIHNFNEKILAQAIGQKFLRAKPPPPPPPQSLFNGLSLRVIRGVRLIYRTVDRATEEPRNWRNLSNLKK